MESADWANVADAIANQTDLSLPCLQQIVRSTKTARTMFLNSAMKANYIIFIKDVDEQVQNLEFHNFDVKDVEGFRTVMRMQVTDSLLQGI